MFTPFVISMTIMGIIVYFIIFLVLCNDKSMGELDTRNARENILWPLMAVYIIIQLITFLLNEHIIHCILMIFNHDYKESKIYHALKDWSEV